MKKVSRRFLLIVAVFASSLLAVAPVLAAAEEGTRYCTASGIPFARGYTTGTTSIQPPGANWGLIWNNGSVYTVRYADTGTAGGGGFWRVYTNGGFNDPGTYSGCSI